MRLTYSILLGSRYVRAARHTLPQRDLLMRVTEEISPRI